MNEDDKFPFRFVWLKPVPHPTASQIEFFHQRWGQKFPTHAGNYLGSRKLLIHGGFPVVGCGRVSESLQALLRELDAVALPYQVETLPIDHNGIVLRPFNSESQPNWLDLAEAPPDYQGARQVVVELSGVTGRDSFVEEMDKCFPCGRDPDKIWQAFGLALRSRPFRVEFHGWRSFAKRMPRYARRIRYFVEAQSSYGADSFQAVFD